MTDEPGVQDHDDYFPDRYDVIEVVGGEGHALPEWLTADYMPCGDCRANMVVRWTERGWHMTVAHDETCPALAAMERE